MRALIILILFSSSAFAEHWIHVKDVNIGHIYDAKKACEAADKSKGNPCIRIDNLNVKGERLEVDSRGTQLKIVPKKK